MAVVLSMMLLLTQNEIDAAVAALQAASPGEDGLFRVCLPTAGEPAKQPASPIALCDETRTALYGRRSARLSPREYSLLKLVATQPASYEDAQDSVWNRETSEAAIFQLCSRVSTKLLNADIPFSAVASHGRISLVRNEY